MNNFEGKNNRLGTGYLRLYEVADILGTRSLPDIGLK